LQTCEVTWSRGYFKSEFYVLVDEPGTDQARIIRSPSFRWTASGEPPYDEDATTALAILVQKLRDSGWHDQGVGESWFRRRFSRPHPSEVVRQ
jgi:hypothetical protein